MPLDPLLVDPLDVHGRCSRRTQAKALLRDLGFEDRMERFGADPFADSTFSLAYWMFDRLVDLRERGRAHLPSAAEQIAGQRLPDRQPLVSPVAAAQAMLDLGWSHLELPAGRVRDVLVFVSDLYVSEMSRRVLTMLRRWEKHGWISST